MEYVLRPARLFLEQVGELSAEAAKLIEEKLNIVKTNPFHYKRIHGQNLFLFRIRFEDNHKEKRVIYLVDKPYVDILFILDRDNEYKDLRRYLKRARYK